MSKKAKWQKGTFRDSKKEPQKVKPNWAPKIEHNKCKLTAHEK